MSNDIARFETIRNGNAKDMDITAYVGGDRGGRAVQFTIGKQYASLSENQLRVLVELLESRLDGRISATESFEKLTIPTQTGNAGVSDS